MEFEKMDSNAQVHYVKGLFLVSIGRGDFDSTVGLWVDYLQRVGFKRGKTEGIKEGRRLAREELKDERK